MNDVKPIEVPCERCGSRPSDPCRTSYAHGNRATRPHAPRRWAAELKRRRLAGGST